MLQRPGRSVLTILGTVLGIAAFVAILGLTATAGGQIGKRFTVLGATEVTVEDVGSGNPDDVRMSFPPDAADRVTRLNGVVNGGLWWPVSLPGARIGNSPMLGSAANGAGVSVVAADPTALLAMRPTLTAGRLYDRFHNSRAERVAVVGAAAAAVLGITRLDSAPAVFVDGTAYTIVGVIGGLQRRSDLLLSVIIPTETALREYGPPIEQRAGMLIETRVGAADLVADQVALALSPQAPQLFKVTAPADPRTLRAGVDNDLGSLFLLLAVISLVIGAVGIANTTMVAVLERSGEIGLRRALGARRRHVAAQFLTESTALGLLGGLVGASVGVSVVILVAVAKDWTAVLQPWTVWPAPFVGGLVGLASGLYPAVRAASIEPADALRR
ncbi:ABC transporter permease [Micromonospora sp. NPDC047644]|uniref:ABC transporter permease n=1 Tax=Micromonospora sp. NPDC047644 TaxID=3157203 RepID=UPI0034560D32